MPHPLDVQNMEAVIRASPEQFAAGLNAAAQFELPAAKISSVLVAGMGGSWMAAALLEATGLSTAPIRIHRSYGLPEREAPDIETLVIVSSFSGNTEETLSAYDAARARHVPLAGMAAGGELEQRCHADRVPFVRIPADPPSMQPRSATGYSVGILTQMLANSGLAAPEAVAEVAALPEFLFRRMDDARVSGEQLARNLLGKIPVIYTSDAYASLAQIWKIKVNENAKTPSFWNVFPELNHNEMIGWSKPLGPCHIILLRDASVNPRILLRFDATLDLLRAAGVSATVVPIDGSSRTERIFSTLLVGDWASYTLALSLGVNPSPVAMVEDLKKRLKE